MAYGVVFSFYGACVDGYLCEAADAEGELVALVVSSVQSASGGYWQWYDEVYAVEKLCALEPFHKEWGYVQAYLRSVVVFEVEHEFSLAVLVVVGQ